jgi:hypothetical protein
MGQMRYANNIAVRKSQRKRERYLFRELGKDGKLTLEWFLKSGI